jgi:hypothetical protein
VYQEPGLAIEHIGWVDRLRPIQLAFAFTERGNTDLVGLGFGGQFLLECGMDLLAFKSENLKWFEEVTPAVVSAIEQRFQAFSPSYSWL